MSVHDPLVEPAEIATGEALDPSRRVRETVAGYIEEIASERILDHSISLFETGLLTSLDVLSLVAFIEDTFGLEISGDDVDMDSFGTIDGLVGLISAMQRRHRPG